MSYEQIWGAVVTAVCSARIRSLGDRCGVSVVILSLALDGDTGDNTRTHDPGCVHQLSPSVRDEKAQPILQDGHRDWDGAGHVKLLRKYQMQTLEPLPSSRTWWWL